jgi:hypothetical protein
VLNVWGQSFREPREFRALTRQKSLTLRRFSTQAGLRLSVRAAFYQNAREALLRCKDRGSGCVGRKGRERDLRAATTNKSRVVDVANGGAGGWYIDDQSQGADVGCDLWECNPTNRPDFADSWSRPSTPPERRRCRLRRCPADSQLRSDARRPLRSAVLGSRDHSQGAMGRGYMAVRTQLAAACARASHRPRLRFRRRFRAQSAGERV